MGFVVFRKQVKRHVRRLNPLKNARALVKLNPYAEVVKRRAILGAEKLRLQKKLEASKLRKKPLSKKNYIVRTLRRDELRKQQLQKTWAAKKAKVAAKKAAKQAAAKK